MEKIVYYVHTGSIGSIQYSRAEFVEEIKVSRKSLLFYCQSAVNLRHFYLVINVLKLTKAYAHDLEKHL